MDVFTENGYGIARMKIEDSDNNYNYIVWCDKTSECAVIDPLDAGTLLDFIRMRGLSVKYIVNTHCHPDHIKGNDAILKVTMSTILVHPAGDDRVSPRRELIREGDIIGVGNQELEVMHTPGHCPEHVTLKLRDNLFVGDTLFLAGCGNTKYRGNVDELYESIVFKLSPLSGKSRIFVGHDYSERNLEFALDIQSSNQAAKDKLQQIKTCKSSEREPAPSTLEEEKAYNPFLRSDNSELFEALRRKNTDLKNDARAVFKELRSLRDEW